MDKQDMIKLTFKGEINVIQPKTYNWYKYDQNNSGGYFAVNDNVSIYVLIQATSAGEANQRAQNVGIYFDGCSLGFDCGCCGDRWYNTEDMLDTFRTYDWRSKRTSDFDNILDYAQSLANQDIWADDNEPSVIVYFADGSVERFYRNEQ